MKTCEQCASPDEIAARDALMNVLDPEVGENIVDLGLIYGIEVDHGSLHLEMTMTSPACPMGEMLLDEVHAALVQAFPESEIDIELVWDPAWTPAMMSAEVKARLGWKP